MSNYTVTVGKGKAVHTASNGATLCGTEKRANDTLILLNSVEANTCKNCAKLIPAETTEETDTMADEYLNDLSDAERFADVMDTHDSVEVTETAHRTTVTVRHTYDDRKVTMVACWHPDGTWAYGRVVIRTRAGLVSEDMSESDVAGLTYPGHNGEDTRQDAAA